MQVRSIWLKKMRVWDPVDGIFLRTQRNEIHFRGGAASEKLAFSDRSEQTTYLLHQPYNLLNLCPTLTYSVERTQTERGFPEISLFTGGVSLHRLFNKLTYWRKGTE